MIFYLRVLEFFSMAYTIVYFVQLSSSHEQTFGYLYNTIHCDIPHNVVVVLDFF